VFSGRLFGGRLFSGRLFRSEPSVQPAPAEREYGGRFFELDRQRHDLARDDREIIELMLLAAAAAEGIGLWEA
jgi:hypothetical protein